jgi:protein-arginine kinase
MDGKESITPLRIAAQQAIEAENALCEQLRATINSAFGNKVVTSIGVKPTAIGIDFEIAGHWKLPDDLCFKPISQSN